MAHLFRVTSLRCVQSNRQMFRDGLIYIATASCRHLTTGNEGSRKGNKLQGFHENLKGRKDIESSLAFVASQEYIGSVEASKAIKHIAQLVQTSRSGLSPENIEEILRDERFEKVGDVLHANVDKIAADSLVGSVETLLNISPVDIHLIKSLDTQVLWLLKKIPYSLLIKVIRIHKDHQETSLRQEVLREAWSWIDKRAPGITSTQDLLDVMHLVEGDNLPLLTKLENLAWDLCEIMTCIELYRTLILLSKRNTKNKRLCKKLAYYLSTKKIDLNLIQIQNLLFSLVNLQLYNTHLLNNLTEAILTDITSLTDPAQVYGILKSCALLGWDKSELIDTLTKILIDNLENVKCETLVSVILACAAINYLPSHVKQKMDTVLKQVENAMANNKYMRLDIVWSCCVLKVATPEMIAQVLDRTYFEAITESSASKLVLMKLKQIEAVARYELKEYQGSWLPQFPLEIPTRSRRKLQEKVMKVISNTAPAEKYLRLDVPTSCGFLIDMVLTVDNKMQPIAADEDKSGHKLAFKVLDFTDLTLGRHSPTGHNALAIRLLPHLGYLVVEIPYSMFSENKTEVRRLDYMQSKISSAIKLHND